MDIQKCFPFETCDKCEEFILKVDEKAIFTSDGRVETVLKVRCKNEHLCEHLKRVLKDEK